jgi:AcrR family transcriptional regulator
MPTKSQSRSPKRQAQAVGSEELGRGHVTEIQRTRMITAMIDVVFERGRANATVAHVVARSGVSRRTFYEVFEDFEDCFLAALDLSIARASEYVLDGYDPAGKWRARIRTALVGLLEFLEDEPAMGRLCIVETLGAGPRVHERRARTVDAMIAAVEEGRLESKSAGALPPLTTEGIVGGALSVLHSRLLPDDAIVTRPAAGGAGRPKATRRARTHREPLLELTGALMGMIVLPYLGPVAAQKESARSTPKHRTRVRATSGDPLRDLEMRLTYRTVRVLVSIAALSGRGSHPSNREVGAAAGIDDQGQISKLLGRLEGLGLIENSGAGQVRGAPNAWALTKKGTEVEQLVA